MTPTADRHGSQQRYVEDVDRRLETYRERLQQLVAKVDTASGERRKVCAEPLARVKSKMALLEAQAEALKQADEDEDFETARRVLEKTWSDLNLVLGDTQRHLLDRHQSGPGSKGSPGGEGEG